MKIKIGFLGMEPYRSETQGRGFGALFALAFLLFVALPLGLSFISGLLGWSSSYVLFLSFVVGLLIAIEVPLLLMNRWGLIDFAPGVISVDLSRGATLKRV